MKLLFIFLAAFIFLIAGCASPGQKYVAIEKCLATKDVKMYGVEWCPVCAKQKKNFGSKLEGIYVECADNPQLCLDKEVQGYPTWIINGQKHLGLMQPEKLAELAGCDCTCTKESCSCQNV